MFFLAKIKMFRLILQQQYWKDKQFRFLNVDATEKWTQKDLPENLLDMA